MKRDSYKTISNVFCKISSLIWSEEEKHLLNVVLLIRQFSADL